MGRPIPRFNERTSENATPLRRNSVTATFNPDDLRTMGHIPWVPSYNHQHQQYIHNPHHHHQHQNPLVMVHPYRGQVPVTTNAVAIANSPMHFIPPWGRQGYAGTVNTNSIPHYRETNVPVQSTSQIPQARRRISMVDESFPFPDTESLIVESTSNRESIGSMPEDYREALRLVIANLMMHEVDQQEFYEDDRQSTNGRELD